MKKLFLLLSIALCSMMGVVHNKAYGQYTLLTDFPYNGTGAYPVSDQNLIAVGGAMYGMTNQGGNASLGTVFKIMPDGTGYVNLLNFDGGINGGSPLGSLIFDGTFLYGMTSQGGTNNLGTIFKIMPDGTGYVKLLDFAGVANGSNPRGTLISDGTVLYGMTYNGGINDMGIVFKIMPDGTGYVKLLDFAGASNGNNPYGSLISDGTFLYGMTSYGGINGMGTIFKIMPDGTGYVKLLDFGGFANGSYPYGPLISDGTFLYGMTCYGGASGVGTIFKIMYNGTGYVKLLDFASATNGNSPYGSLIFDGTFLYGMTSQGGTYGRGILFKIMPDGTGYVKLFDFGYGINGYLPYGSLIFDGTFLYGMARFGGSNSQGTIFKIQPDGTGFVKLLDFASDLNGNLPTGSLISDGTFLYGMTSGGGTNDLGTLFKIMPDGSGYQKLFDFTIQLNGLHPYGSLISDGTFFYGMTYQGGTNNVGTLFKILPDGTGFTKLFDFNYTANGFYPCGSLNSDGTFLYGLTRDGGANNIGTLFKIMPDGTGYVNLLDFAGVANGSNPRGTLISDGTFLYGMTYSGGINDMGTVFKIMPDGTGYVKLLDFAGTVNGSNPYGSLISDGTFLYGMTSQGGTNNVGTAFKIMPDGTGYVKLLDFAGTVNGSLPFGSLISDGTFLYGMTWQGGINNMGTLFKILPDGTGYVKLIDFTGLANGSYPRGSLISDGTFLYGMTSSGSNSQHGSVFKYQLCTPVTANATALSVCPGTSVTLTGGGATSYLWTGGITDGVAFVPAATSTYSVTGTGGNSCTNTTTITITVGPFLFSQSSIICSGQSLTVGNNIYAVSGTYTDTLIAMGGCDSIVTTNLNVLPANTFSQSPTVCPGQSITVGNNTYSNSGTYTDSLISINGCDSIVTTNLTVLPANTFSQSPAICPGQYLTVGNNIYTISGTYTDSLTSMNGCDSIVTTNLTVLNAITFSQSPVVCAGQSFIVGNNMYTISGTYTDSLTSMNGCDSIVTTNLTVLPSNTFSQSLTICAGQNVIVGNNSHNTSGTYIDVLTTINGCDSTVTTNLTVLPASTFSQSPVICAGQSFTVGTNSYSNSGTYTDVFTAMNGCDSIVTTNLTVLPAISNSLTIVPATCGNNNGSAAVSPSGGGGGFTFLWSNGDNTAVITGLTGSPTDTLYVTITDANGCTLIDTAIVNCLTGVNEWSMDNQQLIIYPNPNNGQFTITTTKKQAEISILNTLGEIIFSSTINQQTSTIDISHQPSGIYFFQLKSANGIEMRKIIKQ